ncbi:hypothetical protein FSP39_001633 [Pinctada imbricata]|uniref:TIR domain-containing protein n=1 Tax=Pinctada imbricata TaxID=66713 RepID=A0AA88Y6Z5_PINIB|nr:hypothetical protein FSP39_001633 [Pinctada imbricata]
MMDQSRFILLGVLFVYGALCLDQNICPEQCRCKGHKAYCMRNWDKLSEIPSLPPQITYLKFQGNNLPSITRRTFTRIKSNKITDLILTNNLVFNISEDALKDLTSLKMFVFSHEIMIKENQVGKLLYSVSRSIEHIGFTNMHWRKLPNLDGLINTTIIGLDFSHNFLRVLNGSQFIKLRSLRELDLSYNGISTQYSFKGLQKITNLNLAGNWFTTFPNFTNMQQLKRLHFQNTKTTYFRPKNFDGLHNLRYLNLNGHAIRRLYNNTFSTLTSLHTLTLRRLAGQLYYIEPYAFNSSSLRSLSLNNNYFEFTRSHLDISKIFAHAPNLENLDLSFNNIRLNETDFLRMINPLMKLQLLKLVHVQFKFLSKKFLRSLKSLKYLYLSQNSINSWDGNAVFGNTTSLQVIDLSYNGITIVNDTSFPLPMRNRLTELNLDGNPFSCSCNDVKWFYNFMETEGGKKMLQLDNGTYYRYYQCSSPHNLRGKEIYQLGYRDVCPIDPTLLKVIISCAAMIGSVLLIVVVLYKCRWNIRYKLFQLNQKRKRSLKQGYTPIPRENDYLYDCFPIYAKEDIKFVKDKLVTVLEERHDRKLCIRDRDFVIGNVFVDNITNSIEDSRKVLLLISNNFARSRWCHFQLEIALHRMAEESRKLLIIVMLQEIGYKYFTNTLRTVLVTTPFITWSNESMAEMMFWDKLVQEIPPSHRIESIVEEADNDISIHNS